MLAALFICIGCSTTPHSVEQPPTSDDQPALALAKSVARRSGHYVATHAPVVGVYVKLSYLSIRELQADEFRKAFLVVFESFSMSEGICGSDRLRVDATEILTLFGCHPDTVVNLQFMQKFAVAHIKSVIEAFIVGMTQGSASAFVGFDDPMG